MYRLNYVKILSYTLIIVCTMMFQGFILFADSPTPGAASYRIRTHSISEKAVNTSSPPAIFTWIGNSWILTRPWNGVLLPDTRTISCPLGHGDITAYKQPGVYGGPTIPPTYTGYEGEEYAVAFIFYTSYDAVCRYTVKNDISTTDPDSDSDNPHTVPDYDDYDSGDDDDHSSHQHEGFHQVSIELNASTSIEDVLQLHCTTNSVVIRVEATVFQGTEFESTIQLTESDEGIWTGSAEFAHLNLPSGNYTTVFTGYTDSGESKTQEVVDSFVFLKIKKATVSGEWNKWNTQRYMGYEKINIEVELFQDADTVEIRFSPELEAMKYKNSKGVIYDYHEELGYYIRFPMIAKKKENSFIWEAQYILPISQSTVSWKGERLKQPYKVYIKAAKDSKEISEEIDIDITGNIYDPIYIRPLTR